ncbi:hypothetical protein BC567DRAFT_1565 [Phyllosticta citribraziliensis]
MSRCCLCTCTHSYSALPRSPTPSSQLRLFRTIDLCNRIFKQDSQTSHPRSFLRCSSSGWLDI